jgi:hypothetical protein
MGREFFPHVGFRTAVNVMVTQQPIRANISPFYPVYLLQDFPFAAEKFLLIKLRYPIISPGSNNRKVCYGQK